MLIIVFDDLTDWYIENFCKYCSFYDEINGFQPECLNCKNGSNGEFPW